MGANEGRGRKIEVSPCCFVANRAFSGLEVDTASRWQTGDCYLLSECSVSRRGFVWNLKIDCAQCRAPRQVFTILEQNTQLAGEKMRDADEEKRLSRQLGWIDSHGLMLEQSRAAWYKKRKAKWQKKKNKSLNWTLRTYLIRRLSVMNTQRCKNQSKSSSAAVIKHSNVLFFYRFTFWWAIFGLCCKDESKTNMFISVPYIRALSLWLSLYH